MFKILVFLFLIPSAIFASEETINSPKENKDLPPPQPPGPENINMLLHAELHSLTKARPPRIWDHKLILTYDQDPNARYVAAAFAHELFHKKHLFFKNHNQVFFLVLDLLNDFPPQLEYRLIVDGLWKSDPENPHTSFDKNNILFSQVFLSGKNKSPPASPIKKRGGKVEFQFKGRSGLRIAVIGNFNHWDPFIHFLEESQSHAGHYRLSLPLPQGKIFYKYVVGTKTFLDPLNPQVGSDEHGDLVSYFEHKDHDDSSALILESCPPETEKKKLPESPQGSHPLENNTH